jgi:hypothetical protein
MSQSRFALVTRVGCSARWTPGLLELGLKARDLIIEAMEESLWDGRIKAMISSCQKPVCAHLLLPKVQASLS